MQRYGTTYICLLKKMLKFSIKRWRFFVTTLNNISLTVYFIGEFNFKFADMGQSICDVMQFWVGWG